MSKIDTTPWEYDGKTFYLCGMCGIWSNHTEHLHIHQQFVETMWNMGQIVANHQHTTITINNTTKPFVCGTCVLLLAIIA